MIKNRAFLFTLYFIFLALLLCFIIIGMGLLLGKRVQSSSDTAAIVENNQTTIVIDAGHGGEDSGAVAPDGTLEKEIIPLTVKGEGEGEMLYQVGGLETGAWLVRDSEGRSVAARHVTAESGLLTFRAPAGTYTLIH